VVVYLFHIFLLSKWKPHLPLFNSSLLRGIHDWPTILLEQHSDGIWTGPTSLPACLHSEPRVFLLQLRGSRVSSIWVFRLSVWVVVTLLLLVNSWRMGLEKGHLSQKQSYGFGTDYPWDQNDTQYLLTITLITKKCKWKTEMT
jgi:hypothetical protein